MSLPIGSVHGGPQDLGWAVFSDIKVGRMAMELGCQTISEDLRVVLVSCLVTVLAHRPFDSCFFVVVKSIAITTHLSILWSHTLIRIFFLYQNISSAKYNVIRPTTMEMFGTRLGRSPDGDISIYSNTTINNLRT